VLSPIDSAISPTERNTNEGSLFDKFTGIIHNMKDLYAFHAVVGYFRSSGYFALQPFLKDLGEIKIIVGINVDQMFADRMFDSDAC